MERIKLEVRQPFGPIIAKTTIPNEIIKKLNEYVDNILIDEKKSLKLDLGQTLAGNVTQEFLIEQDIGVSSGWVDFLAKATQAYINIATKNKITEFKIINSWIVRQFENEYNPTHAHSGHISGAGYLKIPDTFGEPFQTNKGQNFNGNLQFINGSDNFLSHATYTVKPQLGDLYLFPHYLLHTVFPFRQTPQERRSVSFNAYVDQSIYDKEKI